MNSLDGTTVLVTGGSSGIGAATVAALGRAGAYVIVHYGGNQEGAEGASMDIPAHRRHFISMDLGLPGSARNLWTRSLAWRGRVDVLVNNAAHYREVKLDQPDAEWEAAWAALVQINLIQATDLMRYAVEHFLGTGGGTLITMSSWAAQRGSSNPGLAAYAATKAGVAAATKTIARAHARDGVLAYCIAPGVVDTAMSRMSAASTGGVDAVTAQLAMEEWVPPQEVAELVVFLAEGRCRHLTGATLDVNGASYVR